MNQYGIQRYKNMGPTEKPQAQARRRELEADGSDLKAYTMAMDNLRAAMRQSRNVDLIAGRLRDVDSAKFVLTSHDGRFRETMGAEEQEATKQSPE